MESQRTENCKSISNFLIRVAIYIDKYFRYIEARDKEKHLLHYVK